MLRFLELQCNEEMIKLEKRSWSVTSSRRAARLPLQPVAWCELTNEHYERSNPPPNKHDGSQYFLAGVKELEVNY